ncbi:ORF118 [Spodoptera frugiperda granulovirus]|uniref:ORF118 n=1 Tax=Spodoptera frugiperda granulovirus TaxID=307454 RepID=A0A0C5AS77_9BBAC|nr:ORF118 [Spodoptera frugiperda granulovirus]AJK91779.1 ORF118 [Spodoptera frugiperda granulovirus]AXS01142.1 ORF122 [Spodoptera frugiperda granulovirus]
MSSSNIKYNTNNNNNNNQRAHFTMGSLVEGVVNREYEKQNKQKQYTSWLKSDAGMKWQVRQYTKQW